MFRNAIQKNNSYIFERIFTHKDWNNLILPKTSTCHYPLLTSTNQRRAYHPALTPIQNYDKRQLLLSQINMRSKGTIVKDADTTKKENSTVETEGEIKELKAPTLTRGEKLKKAVKEYGSTVIVFHVGISLVSLGTCYLLVSSGLDITKVFAMLKIDEWLSKSEIAASAGTFAVAYAVHKVFAPVRITITLASVPLIVRYLRKIGFLKK